MIWLQAAALAEGAGGFDAHGFRLASAHGDLRDPVQFVRPGDIGALEWSVGGVADYASRPLRFESGGQRVVALEDVLAIDLAASLAPIERLRIDLGMPVIVASTGLGQTAGPTVGDLRGSVLVAALQPSDTGGFGLGGVLALDVPTGDPERWLGTVGPAAVIAAVSTMELDRITLSWLAGGRLAPSSDPADRPAPTLGGDTLEGAGSVGAMVSDAVALGVEAQVSVPVDPVVRTAIGVPAGALGSVRYRFDSGGYVTAGVGTGLSAGAGASPLRVMLGAGIGGKGARGPRDGDGDGFEDKTEPCPGGPETRNGYRDDDGCPDSLPAVEFVAMRGDAAEPGAALLVTRSDGTTAQGMGRITEAGMPGTPFTASAKIGACFGAQADGKIPAEGTLVVPLPIGRQDAEIAVSVTDAVGRPLEGAEARYLVEDEACAPYHTDVVAGKGVHVIGAGPVTVFLTAPGYGVHQATFTLTPGKREIVDAKLAPTQVAIKDGVFRLSRPLQFGSGTPILGASSVTLLGQVASLMLSNDGQKFQILAYAPPGDTAKKLSQQRAATVVEQLVGMGVPAESLVGVGRGGLPSNQRDYVAIKVLPPAE